MLAFIIGLLPFTLMKASVTRYRGGYSEQKSPVPIRSWGFFYTSLLLGAGNVDSQLATILVVVFP